MEFAQMEHQESMESNQYGSLTSENEAFLTKRSKRRSKQRSKQRSNHVKNRKTTRNPRVVSDRSSTSLTKQQNIFATVFPKLGTKNRDVNKPCDRDRTWLYTMLNSKSHQPQALQYKKIMTWIILIDVIFFIVSTEPQFRQEKWQSHDTKNIFYVEEGIISSIFLLEYIARLVTVTESHKYNSRWKYLTSIHAVIDALATFPFFFEELLFKYELFLPQLTYLRMFRLIRILRTETTGRAVESLARVIYYNSEMLYVSGVMGVGLIMVTAILMYYLRPRPYSFLLDSGDEVNHTQDDEWSISTTLYYSTLMLTGQGGPPEDEENVLPWYTKSVVLLTGLFSIGMFAIPASMLTWGFEAEAQRVASKNRKRHLKELAGEKEIYSSSSSSDDDDDDDGDTSDEEYYKLIAGDDGNDDDDDDDDDDYISNQGSNISMTKLEESYRKMNELSSIFQEKFEKTESDESTMTKETLLDFLHLAKPLLSTADISASSTRKAYDGFDTENESSLVPSRMKILEEKMDKTQQSLKDTNDRLDQILQILRQE